MRVSGIVVPLFWLLAPFVGAAGQDNASLQQGARIRIERPEGKKLIGIFSGVDGDSLRYVARPSGMSAALALADVKTVQVSRRLSRGKSALVSGLLGLTVGAAAGAALATIAFANSPLEGCGLSDCSRVDTAVIGAILGGGAGIATGAIYGAVKGRESWQSVPLGSR